MTRITIIIPTYIPVLNTSAMNSQLDKSSNKLKKAAGIKYRIDFIK